MARKERPCKNFRFEALERRELLACSLPQVGTSVLLPNTVFAIGTAENDKVGVAISDDKKQLTVLAENSCGKVEKRLDNSGFRLILFAGQGGDDTFTNETDIPT